MNLLKKYYVRQAPLEWAYVQQGERNWVQVPHLLGGLYHWILSPATPGQESPIRVRVCTVDSRKAL